MPPSEIRIEDPNYTAILDPARKLIQIELRGHWDADVATAYDRAFREALEQLPALGCPLGEQVTLIDLTGFAVQSQNVLALLAPLASDPAIAPRRTAIVLDSMLLKMQAQRVAPDYRVFSGRPEALRWLLEPNG